jgi:antitoxin component YwqK of YwqJK toxin-antitoxin module
MPNELGKKNLSFYVLENGSNNRIGPLCREDLLLGIVNKKYNSTTYAWTGGLKDWLKLSDAYWDKIGVRVQEEESFLPPPPPRPSPPPIAELVTNKNPTKSKLRRGKLPQKLGGQMNQGERARGQTVKEIVQQQDEFLLDELNWVHAKKEDPKENYVCYPDSAEKFSGKAVRRSRNGKLLHLANFRDGLPWGEEKIWYSSGQLQESQTWEKGSLYQSAYTLKSGQYILSANLKGEFTDYYENGQKRSYSFYKNGKLHGASKGWYENGKIKWDSNYSNGELNGYLTEYDENGRKEMFNSEGQTKADDDIETAKLIGFLGSVILVPLSIFLLIHYDESGDQATGQFWVGVLFISLLVGFFSFIGLTSNSSGSSSSTSNTYRMASMHQRQQQLREMREMNDNMSDMF